MRLCLRLAVPVAGLMLMAIGLVYVRTEIVRAGNHLHALYREKRSLEKACYRLELSIANLKSPQRLRQSAVSLKGESAPDEAMAQDRSGAKPLQVGKGRPSRP